MFRKLPDPGAIAPAELTVTIDGQTVSAEPGESVAAVLLRLDPPISRTTPVNGSPRTPYCMMGVCFECLANVDGVGSVQTCLVPVRDGMRIERQHGRRVLALAGTSCDDALVGAAVPDSGIREGVSR
jgi:D-hydroxyproline dehydrogenase subunit gamma